MARTEAEILQSYQDSAKLSDPTVDVTKGPLLDVVGRPLSQVLPETELAVERLQQIYSLQFAQIGTEAEAEAFLTNWAEAAGLGSPSRVRVFFMRFSRPAISDTFSIPVGSIISNADQSLQYVTIEAGVINGAFPDTYFNPQRRTYEIALNCIAVRNGPEYDLPRGRINRKVSQLAGIDAIENREDATGGVSAETTQAQITRVQEKFSGLAVNTPNGALVRIRAVNPTLITDVKAVLSTDRRLFRRLTSRPGADYYMIGTLTETVNQTYTSISGGETEIALTNTPALSINQVLLNNVPITSFYLERDDSLATGGSAWAQDRLILAAPLIAGDTVLITVTYNSLLRSVQEQVFGQTKLFQTNELVRQFRQIPLNIELQGKALPSFDPTVVQNAVNARLQAQINTGLWQGEILPEVIIQDLKVNVAGLSKPNLLEFQRSTGALDTVETIVIEDNELATYDATRTTVTIRST